MQKLLVGLAVGGIILAGGIYMVSTNNQKEVQLMTEKVAMEEKAMMEKEQMEKADMMKKEEMMKETVSSDKKMMDDEAGMMKKDESTTSVEMMKTEESVMESEKSMMKKAGLYAPYEASKLAMANTGNVVLFFKASWCPSCRTLDTAIKTNLDNIPSDLTILELDYDTATALKQQYGVTTQHTLVQVDANGKLIKKWSGGSTVASIVEQIQ